MSKNITNIKLKNSTRIINEIEQKYGVSIDDEKIMYDLDRYNKIKNLFSRNPEAIDEYAIKFLNVKCSEYDEYSNYHKYKLEIVNEIKMAFNNLLYCVINSSSIKHEKYNKEIVEDIKRQTYILPLVLTNSGFRLSVSANPSNQYSGKCFFPDGQTKDIVVDATNNQYMYYENDEQITGDVIDYLIKTTFKLKFTDAIETLAKMIDYKLPNYLRSNENKHLIEKYKLSILSDIYLELINESFTLTSFYHPEMSDSEIMKVYRFR